MANHIIIFGNDSTYYRYPTASYAKSLQYKKEDYIGLLHKLQDALQAPCLSKHQKKRIRLEKGRVHRICKRHPPIISTLDGEKQKTNAFRSACILS